MKQVLFIFLFCVAHILCFSQSSQQQLLACFDKVEYYPNGLIKTVYKCRDGKPHGSSIEFNEGGEAVAIGRYNRGVKSGIWRMSAGRWFI